MMENVRFTLNDAPVEIAVTPDDKLLDALRGFLGLTGTKRGCESASCGSCTVIVDGKARRACSVKTADVQGKTVETIEGLDKGGRLHPVQRAFLAAGAFQCGFCTPGVIMAVKALLDENPGATEAEIKRALKRNICRCTGYASIVEAVRIAQSLLRDEAFSDPFLGEEKVGRSAADIEGLDKVTGRLLFADDYRRDTILTGVLVWSPHPHARVLAVDTRAAAAVPGVRAVYTADDIPGTNGIGWFRADQPALAQDRVRFVGDAIALVVADDARSAEAGRAAVQVDYEVLPVIDSPEKSLLGESPTLYSRGNVLREFGYEHGDIEVALAGAHLVVEDRFTTPFVEHAYLEPESAMAELMPDGVLAVRTGTQYPFEAQEHLCAMLALPPERVKVVVTPIGGAFGGKTDVHPSILLAGLAALKLEQPVKITLSRSESLRSSTKRHAFDMKYRVGFDANGSIVGVSADLLSDAGPYTGQSDQVIEQASIFACGPYRVPTYQVRGTAVYTNNALGGAFRGYGINQVSFAMETLIDQAAAALGIDPVQIRLRNALRQGEATAAGETLRGRVGTVLTLEAIERIYERERHLPASRPGVKRGVGVAAAYKNVGWGRGSVDTGAARLRLEGDGTVRLLATAPDMGQGINTGLVQILAETLGLHTGDIEVDLLDTSQLPSTNGGSAQRMMFCAGNAVVRAAARFNQEIAAFAERRTGIPGDLPIRLHGRTERPGDTAASPADLFLTDVAAALAAEGSRLEIEEEYTAPKTYSLRSRGEIPDENLRFYPAYSYTSALAVVEVDEVSGEIDVVKMCIAQDVGRAINPKIIEGQIHGCCLQALGYALTEQYALVGGVPASLSYARLGVPTIEDAPEYEVVLVESLDEHGPLGARGISEVAMVPACPAITNAVAAATGERIHSIPLRRRRAADNKPREER